MAIRFLNDQSIAGVLSVVKSTSLPLLNIFNSSNGSGSTIKFSDISNLTQNGTITYVHTDTQSYGSGNAFILTSDQSSMTILADGKLMYKEGIYSKPATGTGAGTRRDLNWNSAYTKTNAFTTIGTNFTKIPNVSAVSYTRINANETISLLSASQFRTAIGAGTVTAVDTSSEVPALTLQTVDGTTTPSIELDVTGGTSGQFLRQDGSWATIPGGNVTGGGSANRLAFWTTGTNISSDAKFSIDATNNALYSPALIASNSRITTTKQFPVGHYTPGETVWEIDPTWNEKQLQEYFGSSNVSWDTTSIAQDAPGGYAIYINGAVNVGGVYSSGFPYVPIDNDGVYYMECYIKNVGEMGHYMGSNEFNATFASVGGNPGSYGYWVMSNTNPGTSWTKVSGYIGGFDSSQTGKFELAAKYWTPQALFNYTNGSGTRACYISGWKAVRVDAPGNRYFDDNVNIGSNELPTARLQISQTGSGTSNTIITQDNARKIFIGRDSIKCTNLSDNAAMLYIQQNGGNVTFGNNATVGGTLGVTGTLTVTGGNIVLSGTGRIQGIDTVSASTDAANKAYVDGATTGDSTIVRTSGTQTIGGSKTFSDDLTISGATKNLFIFNTSETQAGIVFSDAQAGTTQRAAIKFDSSAETLDFFVNDEVSERMSISTTGVLTINSGNIILNGTGRIQGIDTVSASTDAVNKTYVDTNFTAKRDLENANVWFNVPGIATTLSPRNDGYWSSSSRNIRYTTFQANFDNLTLESGYTYYLVISRYKKGGPDNSRSSDRTSNYKIPFQGGANGPYAVRPTKLQITSLVQNFDFRPDLYYTGTSSYPFPRPSGYKANAAFTAKTSRQNFAFRIQRVTNVGGAVELSKIVGRLGLLGDRSNGVNPAFVQWKTYQ